MESFTVIKNSLTSRIRKQTTSHPLIFVLLVLVYFGYIFYQHLNDSSYMGFIDNLNFFIHELGHPLFALSGNQFIAVLGGTLLQVIIPALCLVGFYIQKDRFAVLFSYAWIGTNFFYISFYSADAQRMQLPLFGMGSGTPIHDWNYILSQLGVLSSTDTISFVFKLFAIFFLMVFFVNTFFLLLNRFLSGKSQKGLY